jgi:hypothetical protein
MINYTIKTKLGERVFSFENSQEDYADKYVARIFQKWQLVRKVKV